MISQLVMTNLSTERDERPPIMINRYPALIAPSNPGINLKKNTSNKIRDALTAHYAIRYYRNQEKQTRFPYVAIQLCSV